VQCNMGGGRTERQSRVMVITEFDAGVIRPLKWSDLRYVFDIKEDCNGKEAIQA
jgi:hypothetical protein